MQRIACAIAAVFALVLPVQAQNGPWHGSYTMESARGVLTIEIELDQLPGGETGMGHVNLYSEPGACPSDDMQRLCADIARGPTNADPDGNAANRIDVQGVVFYANSAAVAFSFPGERLVRVAEIQNTNGQYYLRILHPDRGVEFTSTIQRRAHSCALAMCTDDRLDDLRRNPASYAGPLGAMAFLRQFPDLFLAGNSPGAQPRPRPQPVAPPAATVTLWEVQGVPGGDVIGAIYLRGQRSALSGEGSLDSIALGPNREVAISPERQRGTGMGLAVTFLADGSGERSEGLLLVGPENRGVMQGSLIEGTNVRVVRLVRDDGFTSGPDLAEDEPDENDMPGIGVYGPSYKLRNVPDGQRLAVRQSASRTAAGVGNIPRNATDILVLECSPDIDSWTFEQASIAGKRRLLDGSWCEISHGNLRGFVDGRYLDPDVLPERL